MKTIPLLMFMLCLQGCGTASVALNQGIGNGDTAQPQASRRDVERMFGPSLGKIPKSDGRFVELYLESECKGRCAERVERCAAAYLFASRCADSPVALGNDCRFRRVFIQYDEQDRVLSVMTERRQDEPYLGCRLEDAPVPSRDQSVGARASVTKRLTRSPSARGLQCGRVGKQEEVPRVQQEVRQYARLDAARTLKYIAVHEPRDRGQYDVAGSAGKVRQSE